MGFPEPQGLYDARNEHDSCGVGFVAHIKGIKSHAIVSSALEILKTSTTAALSAQTRCWAMAPAS